MPRRQSKIYPFEGKATPIPKCLVDIFDDTLLDAVFGRPVPEWFKRWGKQQEDDVDEKESKMKNGNFETGDVVVLKNGDSVKMTVHATWPDHVQCVWFDGTTLKSGEFWPDALQLISS